MIDTSEILNELKKVFTPSRAEVLARVIGRLYNNLANMVSKVKSEKITRENRTQDKISEKCK